MALLRRRRVAGQPAETMAGPPSTLIRDAKPREKVTISGTVVRMTARPTSGQPALLVLISDDTGTVVAVWTGRREIGGITLGRRIAISGVSVLHGDHLEFTNPHYTLLSR